ncbi:hypothetical protein, partial [Streptomyces sp. NPDC055140]
MIERSVTVHPGAAGGDGGLVDGIDLHAAALAVVVEVPLEPAGADQVLAAADPVRTVEAFQVGFGGAGLALKP